jgi:hypothetical protein
MPCQSMTYQIDLFSATQRDDDRGAEMTEVSEAPRYVNCRSDYREVFTIAEYLYDHRSSSEVASADPLRNRNHVVLRYP